MSSFLAVPLGAREVLQSLVAKLLRLGDDPATPAVLFGERSRLAKIGLDTAENELSEGPKPSEGASAYALLLLDQLH